MGEHGRVNSISKGAPTINERRTPKIKIATNAIRQNMRRCPPDRRSQHRRTMAPPTDTCQNSAYDRTRRHLRAIGNRGLLGVHPLPKIEKYPCSAKRAGRPLEIAQKRQLRLTSHEQLRGGKGHSTQSVRQETQHDKMSFSTPPPQRARGADHDAQCH